MTQPLPSTRAGTTDLPEPNLPAVLALLADENGAFTVPLTAQGAALEMQVLGWADYEASYAQLVSEGYTDPQMIFRCLWEGAAVAEFPVKMEPRAVDFFPVQLQMPAHLLNREGVWSVGYSAEVEVIGNPSTSSSIQIRIDRTAPNFGNPAPLRNDNVRLVDPTYLANNAQQAIFFSIAGSIYAWATVPCYLLSLKGKRRHPKRLPWKSKSRLRTSICSRFLSLSRPGYYVMGSSEWSASCLTVRATSVVNRPRGTSRYV